MLHATWRRILRSRGRLVLTVAAVALGVMFLTGSMILADSTRAALDDSYAQVYAGVDVVVRGPESFADGPFLDAAPLSDGVLRRAGAVPGVADAEGRTRSVAQLVHPAAGPQGEAGVATVLPSDPAAAAIELRAGRLPREAGEVAVDAAVAEALGLVPGDRLRVVLPAGEPEVRVVGTVGFGRLDGLAGGARVLFPPAGADVLDAPGYAEIAVRADDRTAPGTLRDRLVAALGDDAVVLTAAEAARRDATAAAAQTAILSRAVGAVAVVALLVGGMLIANTFRMLVGQRTRELALLRAVGASPRQVAGSVLVEAGLTGTVGAVTGAALGVGAGVGLVALSGGLLPGLPPAAATLRPSALLVGPLVGILVALLAGRGAARRALAVPPVAAIRSVAVPDRGPSRLRLAAGGLLVAAGVAAAVVGSRADTAALLAAAGVAAIVGAGLLFPFVTGPVLAALGAPLARLGVTGALARQQAVASPRRTGATAAALAVTLGLVSFLLVFGASLGAGTPELLTARQHAEFSLRSTAREGLHDFLLDVAADADRLPGVAAARAVTYGQMQVRDPGSDETRPATVTAYAVDPAVVGDLFDVRVRRGELAGVGADELAVRESVATANGWQVGDELGVEFPDGTRTRLSVAALFEGAVTTDWVVAPQTIGPHLLAPYREAYVKLSDDASAAAVRPELERLVGDRPAVELLGRDEQAAEAAEANVSTLGILTALFALSLVVGVLGVANTLTLAVIERIHELGLLRAVGATRAQVRGVIRWEAALTSALGAVLGAATGLGLSWLAIRALPGASLPFTVPILHVGAAVLATLGLGVVASALPAARAARIDVLAALRTP